VTERFTRASIKGSGVIECIGKGGQVVQARISEQLYSAIVEHFNRAGEPLAARRGYQAAWRRAVEAVHGQVTGTHGLRRLSTQEFYRDEYRERLSSGSSPHEAKQTAREEAVQRLGHSRDRADQAAAYLGPAA